MPRPSPSTIAQLQQSPSAASPIDSPAAAQRPRGGLIAAQQAHRSAYGAAEAQQGRATGWNSSGYGFAGGSYGQVGSQQRQALSSQWDQFTDSGSKYRRLGGPTSTFRRQAVAPPRSRPLGMANLGNTCYINATLQVRPVHVCWDAGTHRSFMSCQHKFKHSPEQLVWTLCRCCSACSRLWRIWQRQHGAVRPHPIRPGSSRRCSSWRMLLQQQTGACSSW